MDPTANTITPAKAVPIKRLISFSFGPGFQGLLLIGGLKSRRGEPVDSFGKFLLGEM
jgi:hypothetical protein